MKQIPQNYSTTEVLQAPDDIIIINYMYHSLHVSSWTVITFPP